MLEDFEVQARANDLTEEDPLLGCNIKVNSFFNHLVDLYNYHCKHNCHYISIIDTVSIKVTVTIYIL